MRRIATLCAPAAVSAAAITTALTILAPPVLAETAPAAIAWQDGAIAAPLTDSPGDAGRGAELMATRPLGNCVACHEIAALPAASFQGNIGPALEGAATRYSEAQLRGIIVNAKNTFDGSMMPAFYKTDGFIRPGDAYTGKAAPADLPPILDAQQVEDVLAFLMTMK
ncbi:sulfur oxidation c-type cytochrome SoxX [Phaeovulum vinaykumarii]|uniref:Monoheme cytochrome SoxX (Sulfur oxidation) n=1 Tax=Phaeovulum vinaykumarii TaxID=407234 RepID=A0A1N7JJ10_9RHOB|nr:sulfur oxidation c-type cytochrome SoxX [Phaeovulum vinaykumarii]SIS49319.1 monoheme cytochrome SoxX (sulfur oxidation) [Phaeovulum vinaykumarii]SOB89617.1 monoheme cytochrome SoxX (sulfur oxidation) [Phaeovulum vinaykumarii]